MTGKPEEEAAKSRYNTKLFEFYDSHMKSDRNVKKPWTSERISQVSTPFTQILMKSIIIPETLLHKGRMRREKLCLSPSKSCDRCPMQNDLSKGESSRIISRTKFLSDYNAIDGICLQELKILLREVISVALR